jgi:transposase
MQKKTITELLALPNFEVVKVLEHHNQSLHLYVDLVDTVGPICSACESVHSGPVHSVGWIRVEDLPLCEKRVFLYIPKRKVRCPNDGKIVSKNMMFYVADLHAVLPSRSFA